MFSSCTLRLSNHLLEKSVRNLNKRKCVLLKGIINIEQENNTIATAAKIKLKKKKLNHTPTK